MASDEVAALKVKQKTIIDKRLARALVALWGAFIGFAAPAWADWQLTPRLSVSETYTNNVSLSDQNREEEYVTSLNPGVTLQGQGGRGRLDFSYNLESLYYAKESNRNQTHQQLQAAGDVELLKDWLFIEGMASVSQMVIDPNKGLTTDNINVTNNRGDVVTTGITPVLRHSIGSVAEAELKHSHRIVHYAGGSASDATSDVTSATLGSGRSAAHFFWGMNYSRTKDDRETGDDSERKSASGNVQYRPRRWISVVGYGGREEGRIASQQTFTEGSYWSAGIIWEPTPRWLFEAAKGDNEGRGRIEWTPTERSAFKVNYLDRDVGIFPSEAWNASFQHRTRRSNWTLNYSEDITSDLALVDRGSVLNMTQGEFIDLVKQGGLLSLNTGRVFLITDEEFERANTQLSATFNTGKTQLSVSGFHEDRKYQLTPRDESANGASMNVGWKLAPRTNLVLGHSLVLRDSQSTGTRETRTSNIGVSRTISSRARTSIDYRHAKEEAEDNTSEHIENRLAWNLAVTF